MFTKLFGVCLAVAFFSLIGPLVAADAAGLG